MFAYIVTLKSGKYAVAKNGIELDRLIRDRWTAVKTIEALSVDDPRIKELASAGMRADSEKS